MRLVEFPDGTLEVVLSNNIKAKLSRRLSKYTDIFTTSYNCSTNEMISTEGIRQIGESASSYKGLKHRVAKYCLDRTIYIGNVPQPYIDSYIRNGEVK